MAIKVKIKETYPMDGCGFGYDNENKKYTVFGGDLFLNEEVEVLPVIGKEYYRIKQLDYDLDYFNRYCDDDGLLKLDKLIEVKEKSKENNRIYTLDNYWVFPNHKIKDELDYLYLNNLLNGVSIKISNAYRNFIGRAPINAVNFLKIIERVIEQKKELTSWYHDYEEKNEDVAYADLFVMCQWKGINELQLQVWQIIGSGNNLLYAHAYINYERKVFTHFDLATHIVDGNTIENLLHNKERPKLIEKLKWLRIDNDLEFYHGFELIKLFFPYDELIDEFTEKKFN